MRAVGDDPWFCNNCSVVIKQKFRNSEDSLIQFSDQISSTTVSEDADVAIVHRKLINSSNPFQKGSNLSSALENMTNNHDSTKKKEIDYLQAKQ